MNLLRETILAVWEGFRVNRLRFLLTLSGVVVGAASLVLLSGLLEGGKEALLMANQGAEESDLIDVRGWDPPEKQSRKTTRPLDRDDVAVLDDSPLVGGARVVGQRQIRDTALFRRNHKAVSLVGTRGDALELYHLHLERGRFFTESDIADRRRVVVVGHRVWTSLLEGIESFDGLEIRAAGERLTVVGVLAHKPTMGGGDGPWQWDNRVLIPDSTLTAIIPETQGPRRSVGRIFVRLSTARYLADRIASVRGIVKATLLRRHYGVENFRVSGEDGDSSGDLILTIISMLVLATAAVSLVVGGINVMNIMLVSVTERTREIGIRRAVGAPKSRILMQFLAESVITSGLGGLVGVVTGIGLTFVASVALDKFAGGWTFHLVSWAPSLSLGTALVVGGLAGLYPAWRASRLDPVEALRFE